MMMIPHFFLQITKSTVITIENRTRYRPAFSRIDKVKGAIREAGNAEGWSGTVRLPILSVIPITLDSLIGLIRISVTIEYSLKLWLGNIYCDNLSREKRVRPKDIFTTHLIDSPNDRNRTLDLRNFPFDFKWKIKTSVEHTLSYKHQ